MDTYSGCCCLSSVSLASIGALAANYSTGGVFHRPCCALSAGGWFIWSADQPVRAQQTGVGGTQNAHLCKAALALRALSWIFNVAVIQQTWNQIINFWLGWHIRSVRQCMLRFFYFFPPTFPLGPVWKRRSENICGMLCVYTAYSAVGFSFFLLLRTYSPLS